MQGRHRHSAHGGGLQSALPALLAYVGHVDLAVALHTPAPRRMLPESDFSPTELTNQTWGKNFQEVLAPLLFFSTVVSARAASAGGCFDAD